MSRAQSCSLAALAVLSLVAGGGCSDSTGGDGSPQAQLALQPQLPSTYTPGAFDLAVDRVRILLIRPPAEAVVDTVVLFPSDAAELTIRLKVRLASRREIMNAAVVLSAGSRTLFAGAREIEVTDVPSAPSIPLQYVGPGTDMTSLRIEPRDSSLRPGAPFTYRVLAFNGPAALENFYVGWSTNDPSHVSVDATGALVAPGERGSFMLRAISPTGIKDSTRVWVSPPPSAFNYLDGDGQTGAVITQLPVPLTVRVLASDALGVPGIPVHFTALSGGTVREPFVTTDANGFARSPVILGPVAGPQQFDASVPGFPAIRFGATAQTGPPFRIKVTGGGHQEGTVGQILPAALVAQITDAAGNVIAGVPVSWQVVFGGGVLEQVDTQTNLSGFAFGIYRLGTVPGDNAVRITANDGNLSAVFSATATAGPPAQMDIVAGDGQTGIAGTTLAPFIVLVTDEFGNPLPGVMVRWNDGISGGGLSATETSTAVDGRTSVTYRLPSIPGTVQIRADVPGTTLAETFRATVAAPPTAPSTR